MNDETKLVTLFEKQELSHQMPGVKVYDERDITRFSECYACYGKD